MGVGAVTLLFALSACRADRGDGGLEYGERAYWEVPDPDSVESDDESLEVGVSRQDCASGETGEVTEVKVTEDEDQVVIQAFTEPLTGEAYTCPENDVVSVNVELDEPIGERELVDGVCTDDDVADTATCDSDVRWSTESFRSRVVEGGPQVRSRSGPVVSALRTSGRPLLQMGAVSSSIGRRVRPVAVSIARPSRAQYS